MPYYIYKIHPSRRLEYVDVVEAYRAARTLTRTMRKALPPEDGCMVRMVFAPTPEHAERLLTEVRDAPPLGQDA